MERIRKNFFKRLFSLLLIIVLISNTSPFVYSAYSPAYSPIYNNEAVRLNRLGLFLGTGQGFDLDKPCDRLAGAVMFIRLVGEENEALSQPKPSPFPDVTQAWATPYVGQMYAQGYSNGTSQTTYGTGVMGGNEFATYILRALGYEEDKGDFVWSSALSTLLNLKIISQRDFAIISNGAFYRDYAAKLASCALDATIKNSDTTLLQRLMEENAITDFSNLRPLPVSTGTKVANYEEMESIFQRMHANLQYTATLDTTGLPLETIKKWLALITSTSSSDVWGWKIVSHSITDPNYPLKVSVTWLYTDGYEVAYSYLYPNGSLGLSKKNLELKEVVDRVLATEITPSMSDKEKVKAIHDYLVKNTQYDINLASNIYNTSDKTSDSYMAYGVLVKHLGVCDGYAKAFNMFMDIMGIPSERVVGTSSYNKQLVNHAWNRLYLDGQYLNVDVTWDDPIPDRGDTVGYDYYLITDKELAKDHIWDPSQFNVTYY